VLGFNENFPEKNMQELKFEIIIKKSDDGQFQAICPSLPGCFSEGKTRKEALIKIEKAIVDYIEMALDWTSSGMLMLKVLKENDKTPGDPDKSPGMFSMEVSLWEDNKKMPVQPEHSGGILGIPFSRN
jgi:predicted RNase H-like HicB family nuclease